MLDLIAAGIGAGAGLLGTSMTNAHNMEMQIQAQHHASGEAHLAREANRVEALKAREWSERMSSSAYQRATADMKAAGINPMAAYQQGGASTPSAASASTGGAHTPQPSRMDNVVEGMTRGMTSALGMLGLAEDIKRKSAEVKSESARADMFRENAKSTAIQNVIDAENQKGESSARSAENKLRKVTAEYDNKASGVDAVLKRLGTIFGVANSGRSLLRNGGVHRRNDNMENFDYMMRKHWEKYGGTHLP